MKKIIAALSLSALMLTALPMTSFAHGHGYRSAGGSHSLCNVENCNTVGEHQHDGVSYSGHFIGDGHDYHQACPVEDCAQTGCHEHDGSTCLPHGNNAGRGCRSGHRNHSHH